MAAPPPAPTGVFTYPGDTQIQDVIPLAGNHALALFRIGSVNLWSVLVYYWVEIATAVVVGLLLVLLNHWVRRPRARGQPYCRRCNYLLIGFEAERCPECGVSLTGRNRVTGGRRWPRLALGPVAVCIVLAAYWFGNTHVPREGSVGSWCQWLSPALYDWAFHNQQAWLTRHKSFRCRVVEIDLADGSVVRTLFSRDGIAPGQMCLHPDGKSFFLSQGDRVSRHRLPDGRRLASWRADAVGEKRFQQVAVAPGGDTIYVATMGSTVWAWRLAEGVHERVLDPADIADSAMVFLVAGQERAIVVLPPDGQGEVWDLATRQPLYSLDNHTVQLRTSEDGRWAVSWAPGGFGVRDLDTGAMRQTITPSWSTDGSIASRVPGADERFVVLARYRPAELHLWDVESASWAGSYAGPASMAIWFGAWLSPDRSVLVAVAVRIAGRRSRYELHTWNLSP